MWLRPLSFNIFDGLNLQYWAAGNIEANRMIRHESDLAKHFKKRKGTDQMKNDRGANKIAGIITVIVLILLCGIVSASVLFSRISSYSEVEFVNVHDLIQYNSGDGNYYAPSQVEGSQIVSSPGQTGEYSETGTEQGTESHPEFRMEAEAEIFRFSYDNESGKTTVIGVEGNPDKLIAPGTSNLYQFTLRNSGNVALDYTLTMEAYVTGTDLWIPVNVRVWDYTNKYLVGSADSMVDVMDLNTVNESAELGAGRYAVYNLEWEWPFERGDDEYDTMLGNLAVDEDLVLHIVIRTVAEYDENPDDPGTGLPPQTGDDSNITLLILLCAGSFVGLCILFIFFRTKREDRDEEETEQEQAD